MTATQPALRNRGIMPISATSENAGRIKSAWEDCFCHPGVSHRDERLRSGGGGRQASTRLHEPISTRNSTDLGEGRLTDPSPRHRTAPPPARAEPQSPARRPRHWPRALTTLLCPLLYEEKERSKEQRSVVSVVGAASTPGSTPPTGPRTPRRGRRARRACPAPRSARP